MGPHGPERSSPPLPGHIDSEPELEEALSRPSDALCRFIATLSSPLVIVGAGGKMGPSLARMARRAADAAGHKLEVVAISRFSDGAARASLKASGVKTVACDLLEADALRELPDSRNVIYLVGLKFGTGRDPASTWVVNTVVPARVAERYRAARIVALSTGNVYPLTPVRTGGSKEEDPLTPVGEYANAAVGRERVLEFFSRRHQTPLALLRLFYAVELRYGVLVDLACKVHAGEAIELANGYFNCIWQGDANDMILRSFSLATPFPTAWNLCHPERLSVREVALALGKLLDRAPVFTGVETDTALLGHAGRICGALGPPSMPLEPLLRWTARWVARGGRNLGRPTHFEVRDGTY